MSCSGWAGDSAILLAQSGANSHRVVQLPVQCVAANDCRICPRHTHHTPCCSWMVTATAAAAHMLVQHTPHAMLQAEKGSTPVAVSPLLPLRYVPSALCRHTVHVVCCSLCCAALGFAVLCCALQQSTPRPRQHAAAPCTHAEAWQRCAVPCALTGGHVRPPALQRHHLRSGGPPSST